MAAGANSYPYTYTNSFTYGYADANTDARSEQRGVVTGIFCSLGQRHFDAGLGNCSFNVL